MFFFKIISCATLPNQAAYSQWAKNIHKRLQQLEAAEQIKDFSLLNPGARLHELKGDDKGCFALNVNENVRIIIVPVGEQTEF